MNPARGLPDLGAPVSASGVRFFGAVDEPARLIHVPDALELAPRQDDPEVPDLWVSVVRGRSPALPPAPYGLLDLRVRASGVGGEVLGAARARTPGATVTSAVFDRGHLRLAVLTGASAADASMITELEAPVPVASNGLDGGRVVRRITPQAALLLREVLQAGALTFTAVAEMVLRGLARRLPVRVSFDPRTLVEALGARSREGGVVWHDDVVGLWAADAIPFMAADGLDDVERDHLAMVLADWTVASYAEPAPAPAPASPRDVAAAVRLRPAGGDGDGDGGQVTWDLSRGRTTWRTVVLALDPFTGPRRLVGAGGLARFWRETVVPPLDVGAVEITVGTNLPDPRLGVLDVGVELRAPPNPPHRVHQLSAVVRLDEPGERRITWQLAPGEPLSYECSTFVVVRRGDAVRRIDGPPRTSDAAWLLVGVADLPVQLVVVGARAELLQRAVLHGVCAPADHDPAGPCGPAGGASGPMPPVDFELSADQPQVAIAVEPDDAERWRLDIEARSLADDRVRVALPPMPAANVELDLTSFPRFGPQSVDITVDFDTDIPLVALELVAVDERHPDGSGTSSAELAFTPARPSRRWTFFSDSPFVAGYRFRGLGRSDEHWSEVRPAGEALHVRASEVAAPLAGGDVVLDLPGGFRFEGLYCYPAEEPHAFAVVPLRPHPERDGAGDPMLMVVPAGAGSLLQMGVQLGPDGPSVERLRRALRQRLHLDEAAPVEIRPAPIEVGRAVLVVAADPDSPVEVAESSTSGFPPYTALFNVPIAPTQRAALAAALSGDPGRVQVRFDVRFGQQTLRLVTDVAAWRRGGPEDSDRSP